MTANDLTARCADLLYTEARLLDRQDWDAWLALYLPDAEYWIPAWDGEHQLTEDPRNDISLIYYADRSGLEDRVFRLRTNISSASVPLPRTCHLVSNVQAEAAGPGEVAVHAHWQCTSFRFKQAHYYAGWYEYVLREEAGALRIARKKTVVVNDLIPHVLDFYHV
jgi:3-phenylpropionate/cinnamic acid dioxygenase small subunit